MPKKYLKLMAATVVGVSAKGGLEISVTLTSGHSKRIWFPASQIFRGDAVTLFASKWIVDRKNDDLKISGESIMIDSERVLFI